MQMHLKDENIRADKYVFSGYSECENYYCRKRSDLQCSTDVTQFNHRHCKAVFGDMLHLHCVPRLN